MVDLGENNDINVLATNSPIIFNNDIKIDIKKEIDEKLSNGNSNISQKEEKGEKKMSESINSISPKNIYSDFINYLKTSFSFSKEIPKETSQMNENCLICEEKLTEEELNNNFIECFHGFCDDCFFNYFKEKINNNDVEKIKCPEKSCKNYLYTEFIENKLIKDISLLEKYKKLYKRKQLAANPNIQLCPFPDCESYAEKGKNKFVTCKENNHKFCFNCLKDWHENKNCEMEINKSFEKWKDPYKVKRCPKCKYYIEKNKGCNHIKCLNCKYEWCWLCQQKYTSDHYDLKGKCFGLQYSKLSCFSNKACLFIFQILILIAKLICFAIASPSVLFVFIYHKCILSSNRIYNRWAENISYGSIILLSITFLPKLFIFSFLISVLMVFIWPLQDLIFGLF